MLRLLIFIVLSVVRATFAQDSWTPEFSTTGGQLEFLQAITQRHTNLPSSNLQFRRNPMDVLPAIPELQASLGENANSVTLAQNLSLRLNTVRRRLFSMMSNAFISFAQS